MQRAEQLGKAFRASSQVEEGQSDDPQQGRHHEGDDEAQVHLAVINKGCCQGARIRKEDRPTVAPISRNCCQLACIGKEQGLP